MQGTETASLDTQKPLVYVSLIVVFAAIPFDNFTGMPNKEPREVNFCIIVLPVVPLVRAFYFSLSD